VRAAEVGFTGLPYHSADARRQDVEGHHLCPGYGSCPAAFRSVARNSTTGATTSWLCPCRTTDLRTG
jgi:hypothetical protein